jgi:hypothetical protein
MMPTSKRAKIAKSNSALADLDAIGAGTAAAG